MSALRRASRDVLTLLVIFGLLSAVSLLPPDTSLAQVQQAGVLRACVPTSYPPLVTRDPQRPGLDVELLEAIAGRLDVRLALNTNTAMGQSFNPRDWRVTRAQCQVLAGGVVASPFTRSFLETTPPHLTTGWALILPEALSSLQGRTVGLFGGVSGLDRIPVSRYLRAQGATATIVGSPAALAEGLEAGQFDAGISEALTARQVAGAHGWDVAWLPEDLGRYPVALGLWKGDLTLKRRLVSILEQLEREGVLEELAARYHIAPIDATFSPE